MNLKALYLSFYRKPQIGVIAGWSTSCTLYIRSLLTNDLLLKEAAGLGVFIGTGVAIISFITGCIRLYDIIYKRFKARKHEA
jgi:ABC-type antimicrobial peptide transport system permease subunit